MRTGMLALVSAGILGCMAAPALMAEDTTAAPARERERGRDMMARMQARREADNAFWREQADRDPREALPDVIAHVEDGFCCHHMRACYLGEHARIFTNTAHDP